MKSAIRLSCLKVGASPEYLSSLSTAVVRIHYRRDLTIYKSTDDEYACICTHFLLGSHQAAPAVCHLREEIRLKLSIMFTFIV